MSINKRALHWWSYPGLILLTGLYLWLRHWYLGALVTLYLVGVPVLAGQRLNFRVDRVDLCQALTFSFLILGGVWFFFLVMGASFELPSVNRILFHVFVAAVPEEVYFRGFFQERLGNNLKAVFVVSVLFTLAHTPRMFIEGDLSAVLTFFPSLLMGGLYYKTGNLLHPIVFHALSNLLMESTKGYYPLA
ncbi:MAG: CPBP family intramembrane metalloprotease [Nitrospirae bacterium]|nr:MAG: CPBP family intramembrane metalloprotease [Nitrospirota bacterium]